LKVDFISKAESRKKTEADFVLSFSGKPALSFLSKTDNFFLEAR
jgi:hypothetical protein